MTVKLEVLSPNPDGFILGRDLIGAAELGAPSAPAVWVDVTPHAVTITASRGGNTSALNALDAGRLSATFKGIDPLTELWFRDGRTVRLSADGHTLWTGKVIDLAVTTGTEYDLATLTAADVVADLSASPVAGAGRSTGQNLRARAQQVVAVSSSPLRYLGPATPALLRRTDAEGSVVEHLNAACDSFAGAAWRPALDGAVEVLGSLPATPVAAFTDTAESGVSYTALTVATATSETVVNVLTVTNRGHADVPGGAETTTVHLNPTSVATYGRRAGEAVLCLIPAALPARVGQILAERAAADWTPTSLAYRHADLGTPPPDLLERVEITRRDRTWTAAVVGIEHQIEPKNDRHLVTLTLKETAA